MKTSIPLEGREKTDNLLINHVKRMNLTCKNFQFKLESKSVNIIIIKEKS
jgi:hypothetical protein